MKTLPLTCEENRWDDLVAASEAGEAIEFVRGDAPAGSYNPPAPLPSPSGLIEDGPQELFVNGRSVGLFQPLSPPPKEPVDYAALFGEMRLFRESLPPYSGPSAVDDIRELRES